jgi:hypothetical protein
MNDSSYFLDHFVKPSTENYDAVRARLQDLYQKAFLRDFGLAGYPMIDFTAVPVEQLEQLYRDLYDGKIHHDDRQTYGARDIFKGAKAYLMLYNKEGSTNQFDAQFMNGKTESDQLMGLAQSNLAQYAGQLYAMLQDYDGLKIQTANLHQCLTYEITQLLKRDLLEQQRQVVRTINYDERGQAYSYGVYETPGSEPDFFHRNLHVTSAEVGDMAAAVKLMVGPIPLK